MQESMRNTTNTEKKAWEPMDVQFVGRARDVIQGGGGKLSVVGGDPGENRKEKGSGR